MKKKIIDLLQFITFTFAIVISDIITKWFFMEKNIEVIKGFFSFNYVTNYGASFGLLQNQQLFFILISIAVIAAIFFLYKEISKSKITIIGTTLVLGGTIGNLIDRIVYGYVRDFIAFSFWPTFNVADIALTIGAFILVSYFMRPKEYIQNLKKGKDL